MLEKQQKNKKGKKVHAVFYQVGCIVILYGEYNGNNKKIHTRQFICYYIIVIISPFTNHFTAGVIIEFQAEITAYCDTYTRETIH